jgi:hypothetical protein
MRGPVSPDPALDARGLRLDGRLLAMPDNEKQNYIELFAKHTKEIDKLQQAVLTGHLIIETALNNIISVIFFHPDHIDDGRFRFEQKVRIARAYALRKDKDDIWDLILAINSLRNEIAHNLQSEKRKTKMDRVRQLFLNDPTVASAFKQFSDPEIAEFACALCTGYLASLEGDTRSLRREIDRLD